ncbi:Aspartyl-tRNA(Asn) amidotransferase subunit B Glutamyl-tRNA(Gln) amidotransferase subunit B [Arcticibacter svalbardensis MN12-7]|uniref:Aspartyl/glutamyl-tRNA(Asn/Gln) amidotransferase subunit B n=1 Tax=Arcticibacter svalbardensis MN12-7 TaxID=1150600 RepID=R9GWA5_9SPHI|nr:Asp-tRNA(Asn)/Glu-tRNA(Gln) amidotransferase subunit GatB [Arcticibacter svalbardensis]EOR96097.1 Aspartyl-tRNA(Asn) amidotransferase subunit B Glutamyl-tRNA(Gln) amidotransferase subunit B [Arcticibacter svalbardensis MN12-7]
MTEKVLAKYDLVIGLEIHAQLLTKTKIFSSDSASFGGDPNDHTSIISVGLPGTLPKVNEKVVAYAVKMGWATNCTINKHNRFDRKNYFYADLPKGYQITQDELPICQKGFITIQVKDNSEKNIRINRIHMEEDAGKSMHDRDDKYSLIDLNRAGVPLIEIVSEPDLRSAEEAAAYVTEVRKLVRYLDICDGNMEEGSLRCDANISVKLKGTDEYGARCEVKNLNSIRNLQRAVNYEFKRQVKLVEKGERIEQNTLNFNASTGVTTVLRSKEMANDYRYFPEPDLPPLDLAEEWIQKLKAELPELPEQRVKRYLKDFELSHYNASLLTADRGVADFFEELVLYTPYYKSAANWVTGPLQSYANEKGKDLSILRSSLKPISDIIKLVEELKINYTAAVQQLFPALMAKENQSIPQLVHDLNLFIDTDDDELTGFIDEVVSRYPEKVMEYHKGKKGVLGLFMGDIMKISKGKIDPKSANKLLLEKLKSLK